MANNKGIQILRTDLHGITSARQNLEILAGQPLYNSQKNYLTVGGPTGGTAKDAPIVVRKLEGWFDDNLSITASKIDDNWYSIYPSNEGRHLCIKNNGNHIYVESNNNVYLRAQNRIQLEAGTLITGTTNPGAYNISPTDTGIPLVVECTGMNERLIIGPRDIYCKDSNNKSYSLALNDVTKGQVNIGSTVFINMKTADGTEATDNTNSISMYVGGNMAVSELLTVNNAKVTTAPATQTDVVRKQEIDNLTITEINGDGFIKSVSQTNGLVTAETSNTTTTLKVTSQPASDTDVVRKQEILSWIYPIGAIFISMSSTNPGTYLGGTWVELNGAYLYARGSSESVSGNTVGGFTFTLATANLPSHNHTIAHSHTFTGKKTKTETGGAHSHYAYASYPDEEELASVADQAANSKGSTSSIPTTSNGAHEHYFTPVGTVSDITTSTTSGNTGSGSAKEYKPGYIAVYVWRRTA